MSSRITTDGARRELYGASCAHLMLLLAQDGSTTRLCETFAGGPVSVVVHLQQEVRDVPGIVSAHLAGGRFLKRVTSLVAHGEVMMDNLSYIALDALEPAIEAALREGRTPIGHLLARWWVRRRFIESQGLADPLWAVVGLPDERATRAYVIVTPEGARMVIAETYRDGMAGPATSRLQRPAASAPPPG